MVLEMKETSNDTAKKKKTEVFNGRILLSNINFLLKKNEGKVKIGELEEKSGVSSGYISRLNNDSKPGIEFIMRAATVLGVSVDTLLTTELARATPTELYLIKFLEKLIKETEEDKLYWYRETPEEVNLDKEQSYAWHMDHPLFIEEEIGSDFDGKSLRVPRFNSRAYGTNNFIQDDSFFFKLMEGAWLFIMPIHKKTYEADDTDLSTTEIWLLELPEGKSKRKHYLCGHGDSMKFSPVTRLYNAVCDNLRHPKIQDEVRSIIDNFMEKDEEAEYNLKIPANAFTTFVKREDIFKKQSDSDKKEPGKGGAV